MERENQKADEPIKEFYFINNADGSRNLVSAIGYKGGYVYFLIESNGNINNKSFKPVISPIANILDYCGSPESQVIAIDPKDPECKKIYQTLSACIDNFSMQNTQPSIE